MAKAKRMTQLVKCDAEQINPDADVPRFVVVKMDITGDRFRVWRGGVVRSRQHVAAAIERKRRAVVPGGETIVDVTRG